MDFISFLQDSSYNKVELAIIENKNNILNTLNKSDDIHIIALSETEIRATVKNNQTSMVVFNQLFYPGWVATIDGVEAQILAVNILSRNCCSCRFTCNKIFIQTIIFLLTLFLSGGLYGLIVIGVLCQFLSSASYFFKRSPALI